MRRIVLMAGLLLLLAATLFAQESLELLATLKVGYESTNVSSITPVGDFNADGFDDLLVGVMGYVNQVRIERAYLFYGGPAFDTTADLVFIGPPQSQNLFCRDEPATYFSWDAWGLEDFNGDGLGDLAIGAPNYCQNEYHSGRIYVYFGGPNPDTTPDLVIDGQWYRDYLGDEARIGDYNGDGLSDIFCLGEGVADGSCLYIHLGSSEPDSVSDWVYSYRLTNFVRGMFGGGDLNGDGFDEFGWWLGWAYPYSWTCLGGNPIPPEPAHFDTFFWAGYFYDVSGDGIEDAIGSSYDGSRRVFLYLGGNPFDFEPDHILWRGSTTGVNVCRLPSGTLKLVREHDLDTLFAYNISIPPDTIPCARYFYGDLGVWSKAFFIGDINADGVDEVAFGDTVRGYVPIYTFTASSGVSGDESLPGEPELLSAYPNPFNSRTTITVSGMAEAEIGIYDIAGRRLALLQARGGRAEWEAGDVPSGVYLARVVGEMGGRAVRLVVVR